MKSMTKGVFLIAAAMLSTAILAGAAVAQPLPSAGADFTRSAKDVNRLVNNQVVATSLTLDLPGAGIVVVSSGGYAVFNEDPTSVSCAITKGKSLGGQPLLIVGTGRPPNARRLPMATTRGFLELAGGGGTTYNFVCSAPVGSASLKDLMLTVVYAPVGQRDGGP